MEPAAAFVAGVHAAMNRRSLLLATLGLPAGRLFAAPTGGRPASCSCSCAAATTRPMCSFRIRASSTSRRGRTSPWPPRCDARWLDSDWALHPALRAIHPMHQRGEVAFVPFAGTHDLSRSHFQTQDTIELGQPAEAARDYDSGFMSRLAAVLGASRRSRSPISCRSRSAARSRSRTSRAQARLSNPRSTSASAISSRRCTADTRSPRKSARASRCARRVDCAKCRREEMDSGQPRRHHCRAASSSKRSASRG